MTRTIDTAETVPAEKKRSVWKPLAAAGIGGAVLVGTGFGVFAQLQANAFNTTPQQVDSGTLRLSLTPGAPSAGFTNVVDKVAPADVVNRLVTVTNTGTLAGKDLTLKVVDTLKPGATAGTTEPVLPSLLTTDGARGLQVTIKRCATPWTYTLGTAVASPAPTTGQPSCATPAVDVLTKRSLLSVISSTAPVQLDNETLAASATATPGADSTNHLLVTLELPDQFELSQNGAAAVPSPGATAASIQGLTSFLTWTFTEDQRSATIVNG